MKVQVKVSPTVIVEGDGDKMTEVFESLSSLQEVFANDTCGMPKCGANAQFVVRTDKEENKYYEMKCTKCYARLQFGVAKNPKGALYPKKRWDSLSEGDKEKRVEDKEYAEKNKGFLRNGGWFHWKPLKKDEA